MFLCSLRILVILKINILSHFNRIKDFKIYIRLIREDYSQLSKTQNTSVAPLYIYPLPASNDYFQFNILHIYLYILQTEKSFSISFLYAVSLPNRLILAKSSQPITRLPGIKRQKVKKEQIGQKIKTAKHRSVSKSIYLTYLVKDD